ncbi:MAG TPA: hypothetical protein VKS44_13095 [Candidatus Acidoferrales bacterium]|nr:hypothetical protein [Candidatus Acidoferrales bacterium]
MDRTSSFPTQDFQGMVLELWQALDTCLYHAAYVRIYANTVAMHLAGSTRCDAVTQTMSPAEREHLQEDAIVFRAHFAGVLWQFGHLAELVRKAYRRCKQEGIVTKERHNELVRVLDDNPVVNEVQEYRNLSHEFAGVIVTLHDGSTDAFIAHVFPPLGVQAPEQCASLDEQEIQKAVQERELNTKLETYCNQLAGCCEGLFRIIDAQHQMTVIPRSLGFLVTVPHSYQGNLPEGTTDAIYVRVVGSTTP